MATHDVPAPALVVHMRRLYSEYLEMPGLRLTCAQAQRLCGIDADTCQDALEALVEAAFLRRTATGQYARVADGAANMPTLRMLKATLPDTDTARRAG